MDSKRLGLPFFLCYVPKLGNQEMNMTNTDLIYTLIAIVVPLVELLGILAADHAIMNARTSQGAIAWAISLITFPWLALILYAVLGRNKFKGYAGCGFFPQPPGYNRRLYQEIIFL